MNYDFYVVAYSGFNVEVIKSLNLDSEEIKKNMRNVQFIFLLQFILIVFVCKKIIGTDYLMMVDTEKMIVRFCSCIILHMLMLKEVTQSLEMFKYLLDHEDHFICESQVIMICLMQFTAAFLTELINCALLCNITIITDYIVLFIALLIIADIDDIYA